MYVILVYDAGAQRDKKLLKIARKYLHAVQKSVFDGDLTESQLHRLKNELFQIIVPEQDAVKLFCFDNYPAHSIHELGKEPIGERLIL